MKNIFHKIVPWILPAKIEKLLKQKFSKKKFQQDHWPNYGMDYINSGSPLHFENNYSNWIDRLEFETAYYTFDNYTIYGAKTSCCDFLDLTKACLPGKFILPISIISDNSYEKLNVQTDTQKYDLTLKTRSWHYLSFQELNKLGLSCKAENIIIGNPLNKETNNNTKPKCTIILSIDSMGKSLVDKIGFKNLLPNSYDYFKESRFFTNAWCQGEWTLPVFANIFTGQYLTNHELWEPYTYFKEDSIALPKIDLLPEVLHNNNFITSCFSSTQRFGPHYGYGRGVDRFYYKRDAQHHEMIYEILEHIRSFPNANHFITVHFMDAHHLLKDIMSIGSQAHTSVADLDRSTHLMNKKVKSVLQKCDLPMMNQRLSIIKEIDFHLQPLYTLLNQKFSKDESITILTSDHGINTNDQSAHLSKERNNISLIVKSSKLPQGHDDSFVESIDLLPSLLKLCDFDDLNFNKRNGKPWEILGGKKKDYIISEIMFPNQDYELIIRDNKYIFHLISPFEKKKINWEKRNTTLYYTLDIENNIVKDIKMNEIIKHNDYEQIAYNHLKKSRYLKE